MGSSLTFGYSNS